MVRYDRSKPLFSIHVPKCGGMSFLSLLRGWFGDRLYTHYLDVEDVILPVKYGLRDCNGEYIKGVCVHGHFNKTRMFGLQQYYPEAEQCITVLRDPFEQALSYYFYNKDRAQNVFLGGNIFNIKEVYKDIAEFLRGEKPYNFPYFQNYMPVDITMDNYEEVFEKYFVYVGIMEDLQTSADMIALRLGFPAQKIDVKNVSCHDEDIPAVLREEYRDMHEFEYAMYEYALRNYKV